MPAPQEVHDVLDALAVTKRTTLLLVAIQHDEEEPDLGLVAAGLHDGLCAAGRDGDARFCQARIVPTAQASVDQWRDCDELVPDPEPES